jgi:hypothetical protein
MVAQFCETPQGSFDYMENFETMYDFIYNKLVEKKIAEVWEEENMFDRKGNIVTNKEDLCGSPSKYNLTHPDKLILWTKLGKPPHKPMMVTKRAHSTSRGIDGEHNKKIHSQTVTTPLLDSLPRPKSLSCVPSS